MTAASLPRKHQRIISCIQQHPGSTSAELARHLSGGKKFQSVTTQEVASICVQLVKQDLITRVAVPSSRELRNCRYYLAASASQECGA